MVIAFANAECKINVSVVIIQYGKRHGSSGRVSVGSCIDVSCSRSVWPRPHLTFDFVGSIYPSILDVYFTISGIVDSGIVISASWRTRPQHSITLESTRTRGYKTLSIIAFVSSLLADVGKTTKAGFLLQQTCTLGVTIPRGLVKSILHRYHFNLVPYITVTD